MRNFRISLIQMDSKDNVEDNLSKALYLFNKAVAEGADLVVFPETMNFLPFSREIYSENIDGRTVSLFKKLAKENGVDIHLGSILETSGSLKPYNTSFYIDNNGEILSSYRKIHLFDAELSDGTSVRESDLYTSGKELSVFKTRFGTFGNAICFDLRFPELFRELSLMGAELIFVPSGFSYDTGRRHWETLLRARAIENGCFIIAPDQTGEKKKYPAYGHTMAVNPDGDVVGCLPEGEGVLTVDVNMDESVKARHDIPVLSNVKLI